MYIPRDAEPVLHHLASRFPALVCTGARQVGKTTLLREAFPNHTYVSLDLPSRAARAEETPQDFLTAYPPPILIDEVQYAPGLFRHLKAAIDDDRHAMGRFILMGGQRFQLMEGLSESLAGRTGIVVLEGLSLSESSPVYGPAPDRWIGRGGFPELARVPDLERDIFMDGYLATYLERDVRQITNVGSLRDFERFVRLLATRNAQQLSLSAAGRAIGIDTKTAGSWLSVLEASGQITLLEPYFGNLGKRVVKTPKLYFNDTGMLSYLLGLEESRVSSSPLFGAIWETAVFSELRSAIRRNRLNRRVYYYRDESGTEVDFLVLGDGARLVEAKVGEHPSIREAKPMMKLAERVQSAGTTVSAEFEPLRGVIVCRTTDRYHIPTQTIEVAAAGLGDVDAVVA